MSQITTWFSTVCAVVSSLTSSGLVFGNSVAKSVDFHQSFNRLVWFVMDRPEIALFRGLVIFAGARWVARPLMIALWRVLVAWSTGCTLLVLTFARLVRFLSSPVTTLYVNHRLRRKVHHQTRAKSMAEVALTGTLKYDVNGAYILIEVAGVERQVRIESSDLACLAFSSTTASSRGAEVALKRSVMIPHAPLKGQIFFVSGTKIVGSGFRTSHFGFDSIVTAFHVGQALSELGRDWCLSNGDQTVEIDDELKKQFVVSKWSKDLDLLVLRVPSPIFASLGVKAMKIAKTPKGPSISTVGLTSGDMVRSYGVVTSTARAFHFKHTVSTEPGWSGSPLVSESGMVIGMHIQGFSAPPTPTSAKFTPYNVGVSFDWGATKVKSAESDFNVYAYAHVDEWDQDEEDARIALHEEQQDRAMTTRADAYGDWEGTRTHYTGQNLGAFTWADDEEWDADATYFESGFRAAPVPTGAVKSAATNLRRLAKAKESSVPARASSSMSAASTSDVETLSVDAPPTPPKKSRRKSRSSKAKAGPSQRGKESNGASESTPEGTSSGKQSTPATPTKTTSVTPAPGSNALSKAQQSLLGAMVPLARGDLRQVSG
jgi:hypothetical protein